MRIHLLRQSPLEFETPWLVLTWFEDQEGLSPGMASPPLAGLMRRLVEAKEIAGTSGELTALHGPAGCVPESILVAGVGPIAKFDAGAAFAGGVAIAKRLGSRARETVAIALPPEVLARPEGRVSAIVEGLIVGTRGPGLRKSEPNRHAFGSLNLLVPPELESVDWSLLEREVRRGEIVGQSVNLARDLTNTPPAEKIPTHLADRFRLMAEEAGIACRIWDENRIRQERFGGLLGVAAGSDNPPAFVILEYQGARDSAPVALVGKGVTFDSGGLSLKPSASMEDMKSDMTGAAVVVATMQAIARLELRINVTCYVPLTENMTGGNAMKLGDVLTMRNGKTVEVLNTDAEGRLILADALSFAAEHAPTHILDLATLTGACMVALGTRIAGLFSNDSEFSNLVLSASQQTGERTWSLPLDDDFKEQLKSNVADLKNIGGKWGGAVTAAKFLEQFVAEKSWAHLDIAGPSWFDSDSASRDSGGTGCFVRTLVALLERMQTQS